MKKGKAIITPQDSFVVIQELFSEILTIHHNKLRIIGSKIIESDPRIKEVLDILMAYHKSAVHYEKTDFKYDNLKIQLSDVPSLAREHFPLCM